jgi:biopolymer transport protein ExbD
MKHLLEVSLIAITLTTISTHPAAGQSTPDSAVPHLQKGISVDLPRATSAASVPHADRLDALVVTIKLDGTTYLGTTPTNPVELVDQLKEALSSRVEKEVYIKADAHTCYASVAKILDSLHSAGIEEVTLLTTEPTAHTSGGLVPPQGFELRIVAPRPLL